MRKRNKLKLLELGFTPSSNTNIAETNTNADFDDKRLFYPRQEYIDLPNTCYYDSYIDTCAEYIKMIINGDKNNMGSHHFRVVPELLKEECRNIDFVLDVTQPDVVDAIKEYHAIVFRSVSGKRDGSNNHYTREASWYHIQFVDTMFKLFHIVLTERNLKAIANNNASFNRLLDRVALANDWKRVKPLHNALLYSVLLPLVYQIHRTENIDDYVNGVVNTFFSHAQGFDDYVVSKDIRYDGAVHIMYIKTIVIGALTKTNYLHDINAQFSEYLRYLHSNNDALAKEAMHILWYGKIKNYRNHKGTLSGPNAYLYEPHNFYNDEIMRALMYTSEATDTLIRSNLY